MCGPRFLPGGPGLAHYYGPRLGKCPFPSEPGVSRSCPPAPHEGMHGEGQKLPLTQPRAEPKARGGGPTRPSECSAWVLGGGQEGEEAPGPLQCRRGSKSIVLGRYFPCRAHAQFKRPLASSERARERAGFCF